MAGKHEKDDYVYDIDNITALMASMDAASLEASGARPRKSKRLAAKSAGKAGKPETSKQPPQLPPASSPDSLLELERLKNQNLKMELEIVKAQLELEKVKSASVVPETPPSGRPRLLQAALTSTPANTPTALIPTLEQLRDKKKAGSTLPNNFVFSSKGTITYESLDLPDFVNGFLEFQKQQPEASKPALTNHLQLLMARASTYSWSSVRSFHLSIATAIDQGRLSWSDCDAIREKSQTFFTHQDLRTQPRTSATQSPNQGAPQTQSQRLNREKKEKYCRDWNYTFKCNCTTTSSTYSTNHRCRVCDVTDHPMLHCPKRKFPIPSTTSSTDSTRE